MQSNKRQYISSHLPSISTTVFLSEEFSRPSSVDTFLTGRVFMGEVFTGDRLLCLAVAAAKYDLCSCKIYLVKVR